MKLHFEPNLDFQLQAIEAVWSNLKSLVGPPTIHPQIIFTILLFAEQASINVDGNRIPRSAVSQ